MLSPDKDMKKQNTVSAYLIAFIICVGIAVLLFSGVLLKDDTVGQIVFGVIWIAVGMLWMGQYLIILKKKRLNDGRQ